MTQQQFDKLKCGDMIYLSKLGRNTPTATGPATKINRTHKKIMPFGINKWFHYSKVKVGFNKESSCLWGWCSPTMLIESLEAIPVTTKTPIQTKLTFFR